MTGWGGLWLTGVWLNTARSLALFVVPLAIATAGRGVGLASVVGALFFLPMLLGPIVARIVAWGCVDLRVLLFGGSLAAAVISGGAAAAGVGRPAAMIPALALATCTVGFAGLLNNNVRIPMVYAATGDARAPRALSVEATTVALTSLAGPLVGGALVTTVGWPAALLAPSVLLVAAFLGCLFVGSASGRAPRPAGRRARVQVRPGMRPTLRYVLALTLVMNLLFYSALPAIPALAAARGAGTTVAAFLSAAVGLGNVVAGVALALRPPRRIAAPFGIGVAVSLAGIAVFAMVPDPTVGAAALIVAGAGQSVFVSFQGLLALRSVHPAGQLAAMGIIGVAIGTAPLGGAVLETLAAFFPADRVLGVTSALGVVVTAVSVIALLRRSPRGATRDGAHDGIASTGST